MRILRREIAAIAFLALLIEAALAQDSAREETTRAVSMTPAEARFQEELSGVTLTGFFTTGDSPDTHPDQYNIERVTKIGDDLWAFDARIAYNNREYRATVKAPVKWAGETPVITLSNYLIKDQGVFSARILIHNGMYAGTWGAQERGGKMFGKIVKSGSTGGQGEAR